MKKKKLTEIEEFKLVEQYKQDKVSLQFLQNIYNITRTDIKKIVESKGIVFNKRNGRKTIVTEKMYRQIAHDYYVEGMQVKEVKEKYRITEPQLQKVRQIYGGMFPRKKVGNKLGVPIPRKQKRA